ncbi:FixH family protein [Halovulum sp. GXIMD14793]
MFGNLFGTRNFTGWHMTGLLVAFFAVIITANFIMAWQAIHAWPGLVVKNSYVASQEFDEKTAERRAQIALGWTAETAYQDGVLTASLKDSYGNALSGADVTMHLSRPVTDTADLDLKLSARDIGVYEAQYQLDGGRWDMTLTVRHRDKTWTQPIRMEID